MAFHCPLCEQEIETDSQIVDGQRLVCPWCEQNFTFYTNVPELPLPPLPPAPEPLIIASGEEFEEYLCGIVNDLADVECEQTKATGDQGVDLVITLKGGERIAVQCKLYSTPVGNEAVQQVVAGRIFYKCDMAAVVTNSTYTDSAIELAQATGVTLLHYKQLKEYLADNGVGTKSKARQLAEVMMRFDQVHPAYFDEIDFLLAYKTGSRWRFSCEKTIFHLRKVVESLKKNGRRPMRETMQLMHLKICDVCDSLMLEVQYGSFGKTLARIYESFDTSGKTADIRHLDGATRQELLRVVKIVIAAGVATRTIHERYIPLKISRGQK